MSNESRENLQGTDGQDVADLTATAGQAVPESAAAVVDAAVEGATASSTNDTPAQQQQQQQPQQQAPQPTQGEVVIAPLPAHLPTTEPRPWYRSRRSFAAKGHGGKVLVAGLGLTYTDSATGAVLLADVDMGFRARTLSAILDATGRRARALFLILAGLEEPHAGRIVAAPSRSWAARLAGRIGSVALIRTDTPLDNALTIRQNILAPLSATGSVADWDNLVGALQVTGLAQRVDLHPGELTAWERFKALIARAIVSGAEVFLIEDPVALPADARAELEPLLRSLANAGCAVVVSTPSVELAASSRLDPASALLVSRAAHEALEAEGPLVDDRLDSASPRQDPDDAGRSRAAIESDLTRVLRTVLTGRTRAELSADPLSEAALARLDKAASRLVLARRFHNTHVAETRLLRATWPVRILHLAGRAPQPATFDADDDITPEPSEEETP